jgi:beta-glucanase (GH16 family)
LKLRLSVLVAAVLVAGLFGAGASRPAQARRALVLRPPVVAGDSVLLSGRTHIKARKVVVQHRVGKRWKKVARVRVRHGRFKAQLPLGAEPQRLRVKAGKHHSKARRVPAGAFDACGQQPVKADGTRWSCTFVDDFDGSALNPAKWVPQTVFASGDYPLGSFACYYDDPGNISVSGGALHLTARNTPPPKPCTDQAFGLVPSPYSAGMVSTYHLFSQQYGRFEARFRTEATDQPGLQESWWLWPDDREGLLGSWPLAGEIDIAETYSQYPGLGVPYLHYTTNDNGGPVPGLNTAWDCRAERGRWNTYTLVWTATSLEAYVNGTSCLRNTSGNPAFMKKYILNLTQALGYGANSYTGTAPLPATMDVDYVKVWK